MALWLWKVLNLSSQKKSHRFLNVKPPAKILDVATGTGAQAYELAKQGYEVTGIDLSEGMLNQARKKYSHTLKLKFLQADATTLPFKNNTFDASSISLGLHDMPYEVEISVLKEIKRVTKRNEEILIVDYMEPKKHFIAKISHLLVNLYETSNYSPFIKKGLDNILNKVGLKPDRNTNFFGLVQIVIVKNNK